MRARKCYIDEVSLDFIACLTVRVKPSESVNAKRTISSKRQNVHSVRHTQAVINDAAMTALANLATRYY